MEEDSSQSRERKGREGSSLSPPRIDFARQTVGCWAVCLISLTRRSVGCRMGLTWTRYSHIDPHSFLAFPWSRR